MMLARVADSLYWIGRYVERAEHMCRLSDVMLNATLDRTQAADQVTRIALAAVGDPDAAHVGSPYDLAFSLALDREDPGSITSSLALARENARQVRDQITTETWERLNLIYLRMAGPEAPKAFADGASVFLHDIIADLHLFKGAADATMSHGEGWRFLLLGVHLERAQLIGRLLQVCFGDASRRPLDDHMALMSVLRMSCALEPYLRRYTADIVKVLGSCCWTRTSPPIRFATARIPEHTAASRYVEPDRRARASGRAAETPAIADMDELQVASASADLHRGRMRGDPPVIYGPSSTTP